jgi:hypothetical protein
MTPSTPKQTSLWARSVSMKPPNQAILSAIVVVKLSTMASSTLYRFNNIMIFF